MNTFPGFSIEPNGTISEAFLRRTISTFYDACQFISQVPHGRNGNKNELLSVLTTHCGTYRTKHALLINLALENNFKNLKLVIGLFEMNAVITPKIAALLNTKQLNFIPEAHCYLKYEHQVIDCTHSNNTSIDFVLNLIEEPEIKPHQITHDKSFIIKITCCVGCIKTLRYPIH